MLTAEQIKAVIAERIPEGLIIPQHTDKGHFYLHIKWEELYPSVTTKSGILDSPHLKKWAAGLAVEYIKEKWDVLTAPILPGATGAVVAIERENIFKAAVQSHDDQFKDAGDVGTRGHKVVDLYLNKWMEGNKPTDIKTLITESDSRIFAIARSAEMFCNDFHVIPLASELLVASVKHRFAGTLDSLMMVLRITEVGNRACSHDYWNVSTRNLNKLKCLKCNQKGEMEFSLVDWKSSNSIDKAEYAMQVSAYWQALYEMTGLKPKRIYIVRLDKHQAKYEVRVLTNRSKAFKAFLSTSKVYDWLNDGNSKLVSASPREPITLEELIAK